MSSWTFKRRLRDLVIVVVIAGIGYYLWQNRQQDDGGEMTCAEERAEVVAKCQPGCEDKGPVSAVHSLAPERGQDDCLEDCSRKYFHKPLPRCG